MKGKSKKNVKAESNFATVKISRITINKLRENKRINKTPISGFIDMAVEEKLSRQ